MLQDNFPWSHHVKPLFSPELTWRTVPGVAGLWPIHAAALLGDAKLLRVLMVRGADPDQPLLWMLGQGRG